MASAVVEKDPTAQGKQNAEPLRGLQEPGRQSSVAEADGVELLTGEDEKLVSIEGVSTVRVLTEEREAEAVALGVRCVRVDVADAVIVFVQTLVLDSSGLARRVTVSVAMATFVADETRDSEDSELLDGELLKLWDSVEETDARDGERAAEGLPGLAEAVNEDSAVTTLTVALGEVLRLGSDGDGAPDGDCSCEALGDSDVVSDGSEDGETGVALEAPEELTCALIDEDGDTWALTDV